MVTLCIGIVRVHHVLYVVTHEDAFAGGLSGVQEPCHWNRARWSAGEIWGETEKIWSV